MKNKTLLKRIAVACFGLMFVNGWSQTVTIPAANTNDGGNRKPIGAYYGYERAAMLYTGAEIGGSGLITDIGFYVNNINTPVATPVVIYMKETSMTTMPSTTVATEEAGATMVYSGTLSASSFAAASWTTITLGTPFAYHNTNNLEVIVEANYGGTGGEPTNGKRFRFTSQASDMVQTWEADNSPPLFSGTQTTNRPNVQLTLAAFPPCSGTPTAGTASASPAFACGSGSFNLAVTGSTSDLGITYQWQESSTAGGPYSNVSGGTNPTLATSSISATTYYICIVTCSNSGLSDTTNEVAAVVYPAATVSVTPSSSSFCSGGPGVSLAASGSGTYSWAPADGLSSTTGINVTATPTVSTGYMVTMTDANGCTATAPAYVAVVQTPTISAVTATPAAVCNGGNSNLLVTVSPQNLYNQTQATFAPIASGSGTTVLATGGTESTALTSGSLDDGYWNGITLPFTFNYFGSPYTSINVQTNGAVSFSPFTTTTGYPANIPTAGGPDNMIAACFGDLNWGFGGTISCYTSGSAPNRIFVINFDGTGGGGFYNGSSAPVALVNTQVQLFEGTDIIQIHNTGIGAPTTVAHSQGIENATGTVGLAAGGRDNDASWTATNDAVQFAPAMLTYSWAPATFLSSTTVANPAATNITATTTYTVTVSNGSCPSTGTVTVTAGSPLVSAASVAPNDTVCEGSAVTLNGSATGGGAPYTYSWSGPNSFTSNAQNPVISNIAVAGTGTYVLTVTDNCLTTSTSSVVITVNPGPAVSVSPTSTVVCLPNSTTLVASGNALSYSWAPANTLDVSTGTTVVATPTASTTYSVTGTGANGCTTVAVATVTANEVPTIVSVTATPSVICTGGNSQLLVTDTIHPTYAQSIVPFSMEPCQANAGPTGDDNVQGNNAIGFNFTYYGVTYSQFGISTNGNIQLGDGSGNADNPFYSNAWTDVSIPSSGTPDNLIALAWDDWNVAAGEITWGVSGTAPNRKLIVCYNTTGRGSGNADTLIGQIVLEETTNNIFLNLVKKGVSTNTCTQGIENQNGTIGSPVAGRQNQSWSTNNSSVMFSPAVIAPTFSWTPSTFLSSTTVANPMANGVTSTTTYSVTVDNGGCTASGTVTVTAGVPLTSTATVAPSATVCAGDNVTLNGAATGGGLPYSYSWSGPNSFSSTSQNPTINAVTTNAGGVYTLTVTDNCTTVSTATVSLTVNPLPAVAVTPTMTLYCNPGPAVSLTASGATTYSWSPAAGLSATIGSTVDASPTVTTVYMVSGTDANGCMSSASTTVTSAPAVINLAATAAPATICSGSSTSLGSTFTNNYRATILTENFNSGAPSWTRTNTSTGGTPANAAWTDQLDGYVYSFGTPYHSNDNSQFVQTNSDSQGSGSTTRTTLQSPSFSTMGMNGARVDFFQYYRDINDNGDSAVVEYSMDGINWFIAQAFTASSGVEDGFAAASVNLPAATDNQPTVYVRFRYIATWDWYWSLDNVTISANSTAGFTYSWTSIPSGFTSSVQNPGAVMPTASTDYAVTVTNPAGCSAADTVAVTVNPLPTVSLGADATYCGSTTLDAQNAGATYLWNDMSTNQTLMVNSTGNYNVTVTDGNGCSNADTVMITINPLPVVNLGADAAFCGSTTLDAQNAGATYLWNDMSANQTLMVTNSGTYDVTVTDANGCSNADTIMVTINPLPVVNLGADATYCGSTTLDAQNAGATYLWSDMSTNQTLTVTNSGNYDVTVTDGNGCSNADTIMVTINPLPMVNIGPDTVQCGGTVVLDAQNAGATYLWNDMTTNQTLAADTTGTYHVTVTDANGCSNSDTVMVTINAVPVVDLGPDQTQCGGSVTLDAQNAGASYLWNDMSTNQTLSVSATGTYDVTVTNGSGCSNSDTVMVTINAIPTVTFTSAINSMCIDDASLSLSGGAPAGGVYSGPGVSGSSFSSAGAGVGSQVITYTYTDPNGCSNNATHTIVVDSCLSVKDLTLDQSVSLSPNPNNGQFLLSLNGGNYSSFTIEVFTAQGQLVYTDKASNVGSGYAHPIDISTLANGSYLVRVTTENETVMKKVIKND